MKLSSSRVSVALVFFLIVCSCAPLILQAWQTRPTRNSVANQGLLNGSDPMPVVYKTDKQAKGAINELELRMDVQRLYALSSELKEEVDRANSDTLLDMSALKHTQEIEKLAKQIRERIKH